MTQPVHAIESSARTIEGWSRLRAVQQLDLGIERDVVRWIETLTDSCKPSTVSFLGWLKSGETLCRLANSIIAGSIPRFNIDSKYKFRHYENISHFLRACKSFGVPDDDLFSTMDLYEERDVTGVVHTMYTLSNIAKQTVSDFRGPTLGPRSSVSRRSTGNTNGERTSQVKHDKRDSPRISDDLKTSAPHYTGRTLKNSVDLGASPAKPRDPWGRQSVVGASLHSAGDLAVSRASIVPLPPGLQSQISGGMETDRPRPEVDRPRAAAVGKLEPNFDKMMLNSPIKKLNSPLKGLGSPVKGQANSCELGNNSPTSESINRLTSFMESVRSFVAEYPNLKRNPRSTVLCRSLERLVLKELLPIISVPFNAGVSITEAVSFPSDTGNLRRVATGVTRVKSQRSPVK